MSNDNPDFAVLLMNMGGPSSISDIQPFLYELFSDKDIIQFPIPFMQKFFAWMISKLRAPKVAKHYQKIGIGSPLLELTRKQASALGKELSNDQQCQVHIGMRYTSPTISEAIRLIKKSNPKKLVILPLYPQFSTTTTLSSYHELDRVLDKENYHPDMIRIEDWFDFPDYIMALSSLIQEKLLVYPVKDKVHLVFSAHSLPISTVEKGDTYPDQIYATVKKIMACLSLSNPYHICYQSKVGPIKWLEPTTEDTITSISREKDQDILIIPISFVSDHYETIYEIDIYYAGQAKRLGIRTFYRIESLNVHPLFIKALSSLVLRYINGGFHE